MGKIYKITNLINGKVYIGKTERSIEKRFKEHLSDSKSDSINRPLHSAIKKYGFSNFKIELLEETEECNEREMFWIKYYNSYDCGYNATVGGDGKITVDRELINNLYLSNNFNAAKVCEITGHNISTVRVILKDFNHNLILNRKEHLKIKVYCKTVNLIFNSVTEASCYLVEKYNKDCDPKAYISHISSCCKGKRKSILKHEFEYLE